MLYVYWHPRPDDAVQMGDRCLSAHTVMAYSATIGRIGVTYALTKRHASYALIRRFSHAANAPSMRFRHVTLCAWLERRRINERSCNNEGVV